MKNDKMGFWEWADNNAVLMPFLLFIVVLFLGGIGKFVLELAKIIKGP